MVLEATYTGPADGTSALVDDAPTLEIALINDAPMLLSTSDTVPGAEHIAIPAGWVSPTEFVETLDGRVATWVQDLRETHGIEFAATEKIKQLTEYRMMRAYAQVASAKTWLGSCYYDSSTPTTYVSANGNSGTACLYDQWITHANTMRCKYKYKEGSPYGGWLELTPFWNCDECGNWRTKPVPAPRDLLAPILKERQMPAIRTNRKSTPGLAKDIRELRARDTLKLIIGQTRFRNFLKSGFVSVKARSGLVYLLRPGYDRTLVYRDGQLIDNLCVVLNGHFPPTDSLIARFLLVLNDETHFRSLAISHGLPWTSTARNRVREKNADSRRTEPLTEIFRKLKVA